jgi:hypothetical protein
MSFCEHCEGQRFDRAQVLRALRAARKNVKRASASYETLCAAIKTVRELEIPHLEYSDPPSDTQLVH